MTEEELKRIYGKSLRDQLGHFPIWDVGTKIAIGDYGVVDDHCFTRMGNVVDDFQVTPIVDAGNPAPWEFQTKGTNVGELSIDANAATATAHLAVSFKAASSLFIRAADSYVEAMKNVAEVSQQLRVPRAEGVVKWERRYCFVSSVRRTPSLTLLMNNQQDASIVLRGDTGLLTLLHGNRVVVGTNVQVTGDAGLKCIGLDGGVYVDLMRQRWLGGATPFGADAKVKDPDDFELMDPNRFQAADLTRS